MWEAPGIDGIPNEFFKEVIADTQKSSLKLLTPFSGGEVLRRLLEAEVGPAEERQQTSGGDVIL